MANLNPTFNQQVLASGGPVGTGAASIRFIARVTHVVQGPFLVGTSIRDTYYNNPTDLGIITFQLLAGSQNRTENSNGNLTARPISSALKNYPLEGEFVEIIPGPGLGLNESRGQRDYFYTSPYNLWNASHHNALPDLGDYGDYVSDIQRTYEQSSTLKQAVNTSATGSLNYPLGPNFPEKSNIKSPRQFTGDVTMEGRWGNSIRFGSTTVEKDQNPWSSVGTAGSPITIIRNGQGRQGDDIAWIPTVENINRDPSSIYLTNSQKIVISDIDNNFSLASLGVNLERTVTNSIPIQQQLTSTDTISPREQDRRIASIDTAPDVSPTSVPQKVNQTQSTIVVGDYQDIFGTYVVSLRAVDPTGVIQASVSATGESLQSAYADAVSQLKARIPNETLTIPNVSKLTSN